MKPWATLGLIVVMLAAVSGCGSGQSAQPAGPAPDQVRQIAKEAYVYGFPMVDSYRIQHAYFVDKSGPQYKGVWNQTHSAARVYTPEDATVQTPNSDTP